jgi:deoxycytidylate deaminase
MRDAFSGLLPAGALVRSEPRQEEPEQGSQKLVRAQASRELVFGVVGHVGAGASEIAAHLQDILSRRGFEVCVVNAREVIAAWAHQRSAPLPGGAADPGSIAHVSHLQDLGDRMRHETRDHAAVTRRILSTIRAARARATSATLRAGVPVMPDEARRAYILDSIRHPAEVGLLRHLYHSAFVLLGVVCEEEERERRITAKLPDAGQSAVRKLMARDARAPEAWGQRVSEAYHLADAFLDNTAPHLVEGRPNPHWDVPDQLERLVTLLTRSRVLRATPHEAAMYVAHGARMRSACLSRQVGAALVDPKGNIVATGTNEVPRAGGGIYGALGDGHDGGPQRDHRCAFTDFHEEKYCSNTRERDEIIAELVATLGPRVEELARETTRAVVAAMGAPEYEERAVASLAPHLEGLVAEAMRDVAGRLPSTRIGGLIEFSRAVHAEMDAILAAGRSGVSVVGGRLYVTTFPCHSCARHAVAAGLDEVQYIEPYPKSRALELHADSITTSSARWTPPSRGGDKVLVRPFTGVAPRLYERVFSKETDLKDAAGNLVIGAPPWGDPWDAQRVGYAQLEAELTRELERR